VDQFFVKADEVLQEDRDHRIMIHCETLFCDVGREKIFNTNSPSMIRDVSGTPIDHGDFVGNCRYRELIAASSNPSSTLRGSFQQYRTSITWPTTIAGDDLTKLKEPSSYILRLDGIEDQEKLCIGLVQRDPGEIIVNQSVAPNVRCIKKKELESFNGNDILVCGITGDGSNLNMDLVDADCSGSSCILRYNDGFASDDPDNFIDDPKFEGVYNLALCAFVKDESEDADEDSYCQEMCFEDIDLVRKPILVFKDGATSDKNNQELAAIIRVFGNSLQFQLEPANILTDNTGTLDGAYRILFGEKDGTCKNYEDFTKDRKIYDGEEIPKLDGHHYVRKFEYQALMHKFTGLDALWVGFCLDGETNPKPKIELSKFVKQYDARRDLPTSQMVFIAIGLFFAVASTILTWAACVVCCCCNNQR
jgi:hypothetical protein